MLPPYGSGASASLGGGGMTTTSYILRGESASALHALLVAAGSGHERPYAFGADSFDTARVRVPYPEMVSGAPDPETGELVSVATGLWLCEVVLVDEADEALAALAVA